MPPQRACVSHLLGLLLLIGSIAALKCPERGSSSPGRELVCYTRSHEASRLENAICRCTTLVHQGHDLQSLDSSELKSLRNAAKEANPDIRVVMSISDDEGILKSSKTTRQDAATYLSDILKEVDGVELNVTAGSKERLVSFVKGLKDELVNKSIDKMILLALPTKPEDLAKQFELKELAKYVDVFTVATHYLRDSQEEAYHSFHPSRLMGLFDMLNADSLVDLISGMGAPKHKILISAPTNAYQFTLKKAGENTPRSPTIEEQPVALDRKKLCDAMSDGEWTVERDEDLTAPYAFKNTSWIAFEDETSLKIKGKYVMLRELAGLALRDVESDETNDCGVSVIQAVYKSFTEMKRKTREALLSSLEKDLKDSEISYPRHVRSSDFRIIRVVDTEGKIQTVREDTRTAFACTRQGYFVHPRSCNRFYRCVKFNQGVDDYSVFEFDCPAGLAFDDRTEVCTWPGSLPRGSACPGSSEIEPVPRGRFRCPSHPGFYADPQNCRWFFACYDLGGPEMLPYEFRCPFGLVFDEHKLVCEWPWKVPNCNGPGHGGDGGVYNYGGTYDGQDGNVPQGGIVGVGGFVGQGASAGGAYDGQGVNFGAGAYDGQNYNAAGSYDGQPFNAAGAFGAQGPYNGQAQSGQGAGYDGQNYNADYDGQNYNAGAGYDGQNQHPAGFDGAGAGYNGQPYNVGGVNGAGYDGQTYNSGGVSGAGYDGQTYNSGGISSAGDGYNGQNYNTGGISSAGVNYNAAGAGAPGADYDGQTYNSGGADYDQQNYNVGGQSAVSSPRPFAPSIYNQPSYQVPSSNVDYDGQNYNGAGGGIDYNNQAYDGDSQKDYGSQNYDGDTQAHVDVGKDYGNQNYGGDTQAHVDAGKEYNNQNYGGDTQAHVDVGKDYDNQNFDGNSQSHVDIGQDYNNQNFNGDTQSHIDVGRPVTLRPAGYDGQNIVTSTVNYDDRGGFTSTSSYAGQGSTYNTAGGQTTQFNAGTIGSTFGANNVAGDTRSPTGFTSGTATNYAGGIGSTTGFTAGVTTGYAQNEYTGGSTTGYAAGTTGGNTAGYAGGSTTGLNNYAGQTGTTYGSTNGYVQNTYGSTGPYYNGIGSTGNVQTNTYGSDISQYTGGRGTTVYNATYNPNLGYPSSTILPFRGKETTDDYQGTKPVNSIIYNSNLAMGLSTSESFGTQYTNQAGKSYTNQWQITTQYPATYGRPQGTSNYNTATNFYDNSNTVGGTKTTAGLGKFGTTVAPNYNSGGGTTNNSPFLGSSLAPNNEITRYNENTGGYTGSNYYNKGTTLNQNPYSAPGYAKTPGQNNVTPSTIIPGYNKQGTPIPGVVPLTDSRPVVEIENSPLYTPGARAPTTQYPGYRTNDVQDYKTPSYTGIPNSFIINGGNENEQSTILKSGEQTTTEVYTRGGFTKTGPTKTGITTAQVGGTGSYVIGTGSPRQRPNPQYIGEHAFSTNTGGAATATNFGTAQTATNFGTAGPTTNFASNQNTNFATSGNKGNTANFGTIGLSGVTTTANYGQSNTVTGTNTDFAGYSYPKPSVQFETNFPSSTPSVTQTPYYVSTTPSSIENQNSVIIDGNKNGYSSTISPVGYTTSQADNFRTTIYQAAGLPQKVSTVRPVIDTGSRTIVSTTAVPAVVTTQRPIYENNFVSSTPQTYLDVGVSFDQGNYDDTSSYAQGSTSSDYSDITSNFEQGIFGQKIGGPTQFTNNYPQPSTNSPLINQNNNLIKSTEENYNAFTQTGTEFTAQTKSVRINQGNNYRARVNLPSQVYLPSTTLSPVAGVTFGRPIVAAEFNQNQVSNFDYRGSNNRFLNNQASSTIAPQRTTSGVLINQASYGYESQGYNNGQILQNQASAGVTPQGAADNYFNNQAAGTFASRGNNRFSSNQAAGNSFIAQNQGFARGTTASIDQNQEFNGKTRTLVGSQVVTSFGNSGFNNNVANQNSANRGSLKIETELNSGSRAYQSTTLAPEITTYTGDYSRTRPQSGARNQNNKVIVKLSDLHPLILGKLGAECTCRADPFAMFRGPTRQSLPINSENRGTVDLANYDESDIYVDVDSEKENQSQIDFAKNIPSNRLIKTSNAQFNGEYDRGVNFRGGLPSSTNLPPTSRPPTTYLPPKPSIEYLPQSTPAPFSAVLRQNQASLSTRTQNRQPLLIRVEDNYENKRAGKALFDGSQTTANNLRNQAASYDRYGSGGQRDNVETLQSEFDCARPGLFRHPKHCNKFYACHWDNWKKKYTLHVFNCPVHLAFDSTVGACNYPSKGPACQDNKLLV